MLSEKTTLQLLGRHTENLCNMDTNFFHYWSEHTALRNDYTTDVQQLVSLWSLDYGLVDPIPVELIAHIKCGRM